MSTSWSGSEVLYTLSHVKSTQILLVLLISKKRERKKEKNHAGIYICSFLLLPQTVNFSVTVTVSLSYSIPVLLYLIF